MKIKKLRLACVISATVFSLKTYSQQSAVCANPIMTICSETQMVRTNRYEYIEKLKKEIASEAEKNAQIRITKLVSESRGFFKSSKQASQIKKIKDEETIKSTKTRIDPIESIVTNNKYISKIKSYLKQAIDESHFNQSTRTSFKATIDSIVVGNYSDYLNKVGIEVVSKKCGLDGMNENAFSRILNNQRYVLICPGSLIPLSLSNSDDEDKLSKAILSIAHEMGHHIDSLYAGEEIYRPYLSCLAKNNISEFSKTKADAAFCNKESTTQAACNFQTIRSHSEELIAEQWAIKVLAIHSRTQGHTIPETDSLIVNGYSSVCDAISDGVHPTGNFRIGTLLRLNPDISNYLACNNSALNKNACSFDGEINI